VTLSLAEPFTATILGVTILREELALKATVGITLLFAGLSILALTPKNWQMITNKVH
jgi:DME family drug/metabolite transporter